jgi:hypothetical protein
MSQIVILPSGELQSHHHHGEKLAGICRSIERKIRDIEHSK